MLQRSVFFVDSARTIVKSDQHCAEALVPAVMVRVGMRQCDLASAMTLPSHSGSPGPIEAPIAPALLELPFGSPEIPSLAAMLSDFRIERHLTKAAADRLSGAAG